MPPPTTTTGDDDMAMSLPKPTVITGSPTPSEKAAEKPTSLVRNVTTASEPSPQKNKKQKVSEEEINDDIDILPGEDFDRFIPDEYATTLTNFAYPELNTQSYFEKLLCLGISSHSKLTSNIENNMKKEQKYYDEYYRNKKMYTNWYWLRENMAPDSVDYDDDMLEKIKQSFEVKDERLEQATKWIVHLSDTVNYNQYSINHFMHLLLNEMDSFLYSVPTNDLQVKIKKLRGELLTKFKDHCTVLQSANLEYDTYDSTLLFDKQDQLHLQNLYYFI